MLSTELYSCAPEYLLSLLHSKASQGEVPRKGRPKPDEVVWHPQTGCAFPGLPFTHLNSSTIISCFRVRAPSQGVVHCEKQSFADLVFHLLVDTCHSSTAPSERHTHASDGAQWMPSMNSHSVLQTRSLSRDFESAQNVE